MSEQTIEVTKRGVLGTSASRRMRKEGLLPGVIYGAGKDATPVTLNTRDYKRVVSHSESPIYTLRSNDSSLNDLVVFVKDENINYLKDELLHVDFLAVEKGKKVSIKVPIKITGVSQAIKQGTAVLNQTVHEVEVECLPSNIPSSIVVNIDNLQAGDAVLVGDLNLPKDVELKTASDISVLSAFVKRRAAIEAEEAAEAAEDAAAEAASAEASSEKEKKED